MPAVAGQLVLMACMLCMWVPSAGQLYINEFSASNSNTIADPVYNDYSDWLEIYNSDDQAWSLKNFFITDNFNDPEKWQINVDAVVPPGGFVVIWADGMSNGLHTSFRISADGEELALYSPGGRLIDSVSFQVQPADISYGRTPDGSDSWAYFTEPTPGASNTTDHYSEIVYHIPSFSLRGGMYAGPQTIGLHSDFGGEIRYTTNGAAPERTDPLYTLPLEISRTTVIRARIFMEDMIPGPVVTQSYFINENSAGAQLPVVSVTTHPDHFWDPEEGIYVQDFKPDWEIPVNIELFENNGSDRAAFNEAAGMKINGLYSWQLPQKMLGVYFRKAYGSGKLDYKIVPQRPRKSYDNFALRASGSDWSYTLFRDVLGQHATCDYMDLDIMGFRQAVVYVNGEYLGIHNIREKVDEDYIIASHGLEEGAVDMVENEDYAEAGNLTAYKQLQDLLNADLSTSTNYDAVADVVDIENFTDYVITEMATRNTSISHNVMAWKPKEGGKWRWILMDLDRGFFDAGSNFIDFYLDQEELLLSELFENEGYRNFFARRLNAHLFTTFNPVRMKALIDEHAEAIAQEVSRHIERWMGTTSSYGDALPSLSYWQEEVENLKNFVEERPAGLLADLQNHGFPRIANLTLETFPAGTGKILVEGMEMPASLCSGPVTSGMDLQIEAKAKPGYQFTGWQEMVSEIMIAKGAVYNYLDGGAIPASDWMQPDFDDSNWKQGAAQLGYGDGDETTVVEYGGSSSNKSITTYFRKTFNVSELQLSGQFYVHLLKDDGAVVFVNGQEILRSNMPAGQVDALTEAETAISGEAEDVFTTYPVNREFFSKGENILAVEVHQRNGSSSDISFDLQISSFVPDNNSAFSSDALITLSEPGDRYLRARFVRGDACTVPEILAEDMTLSASCSPYLATGDVLVPKGVTLNIEAGVEIRMPEDGNIFVYGTVRANGTEELPVRFVLNPGHQGNWGGMVFKHTPEASVLNHVEIEDATGGPDPVTENAAISAFNADLEMHHMEITKVGSNPIMARYSDIVLTDSRLHSEVTGDLVNVKYGHAKIINSEFIGNDQPDTDGIDYDEVTGGIIRNCTFNHFYGFNSDAIDIGEQAKSITIDSIFAMNITDKGVSLGQHSSARITNSVFVNCNMGVVVKDSSSAFVQHSLFYGNGNAVYCFEKNIGMAGGNAYVTNSVLSNTIDDPVYADKTSHIEISYSLSDTRQLPTGNGNIHGNPLFSAPSFFNFEYQEGSPAIMAGHTENGPTNMGSPFVGGELEPFVCISEFFIDPAASVLPEFIALYNPSGTSIDLSGYAITKGVTAVIPDGVTIGPGGRVYLTDHAANYFWDQVEQPVIQWMAGKLSDNGESIQLEDRFGIAIDYFVYDIDGDWPTEPFTGDQMFVLKDASLDNHFPGSWKASSLLPVSVDASKVSGTHEYRIYPNPTSGMLYIEIPARAGSSFSIFNPAGSIIYSGILNQEGKASVGLRQFGQGLFYVRSGAVVEKVIVVR